MAPDPRSAATPWLREPPAYTGPFRLNIHAFLSAYGRRIPLPGLRRATAYVVDLSAPGSAAGVTRLHVYQENLDEKDGLVCDQCRCMGEPPQRAQQAQQLPFVLGQVWGPAAGSQLANSSGCSSSSSATASPAGSACGVWRMQLLSRGSS